MDYINFLACCKALKAFFEEQQKLSAVIFAISPSCTGVCEFGNEFVEHYVRVVELALKDDFGWFNWFVFENNFGKKKLSIIAEGVKFTICDEADFFKVCNGYGLFNCE